MPDPAILVAFDYPSDGCKNFRNTLFNGSFEANRKGAALAALSKKAAERD
jgi:hypothetical protein